MKTILSSNLADYLIELSTPRALEEFKRSPERAMETANLSDSERVALLSKRPDLIRLQGAITQQVMSPRYSVEKSRCECGQLVVVGTGISVGQMTSEARGWIEFADTVLYCVSDIATERLILTANANAQNLMSYYADGKQRAETYDEMVSAIMQAVRKSQVVCAVFYGHPGVFAFPSHEAIRQARSEGFQAIMLPAVSALDCMVADLGIDIAYGCQILGAGDLLMNGRTIDTSSTVVIWQVGAVGNDGFNWRGFRPHKLPEFVEALIAVYGPTYPGILYRAAQYAHCDPQIVRLRLMDITIALVNAATTLVLEPATGPRATRRHACR